MLLALLVCAAASAEPAKAGLRIAVISDLNGSYGSVGHNQSVSTAIDRIIELRPDLVISTGDMIAGQLRNPEQRAGLDAMWTAFHHTVTEPLEAAGIPFAVTPGNHDGSAYPDFRDERVRYARAWQGRMPKLNVVDGSGYPFSYAFSVQDVLFISLDVTMTDALPEPEFEWLENLLQQHRDEYRQVIVFSHIPVWPVADGRDDEATKDIRLHELLTSARVDLYLSGHHHAFYPGAMDGVGYISQACLGAGARRLTGSQSGRAPRAFTWLDIEGGQIGVDARIAPDFRSSLDWQTLPSEIRIGNAALQRADLVDVAIAPLPPPRAVN